MTTILALELFGYKFPDIGLIVVVGGLIVAFLLMNRNGGLEPGASGADMPGKRGRGRMYQCTRCGRNFQPEQVEYLASGEQRTHFDDRCPNCGWDLDWGDADKKPGGASGGW